MYLLLFCIFEPFFRDFFAQRRLPEVTPWARVQRFAQGTVLSVLEIEVYSPLMLYHVPRATDFENNEVGA